MKKIMFMMMLFTMPFQAFCQTWVCNLWNVESNAISLQQCGHRINSIYCQNPYASTNDQRWVIDFD